MRWFFDSIGNPIAFALDDAVWSLRGQFIGYFEGNEIWYGEYKGESILENRLAHNKTVSHSSRDRRPNPPIPFMLVTPLSTHSVVFPYGYDDIKWTDNM
jgi:hypothetical protein